MAEFLIPAYFKEEEKISDDGKSKVFAIGGCVIFLRWWDIFKTQGQDGDSFRRCEEYNMDTFNQLDLNGVIIGLLKTDLLAQWLDILKSTNANL